MEKHVCEGMGFVKAAAPLQELAPIQSIALFPLPYFFRIRKRRSINRVGRFLTQAGPIDVEEMDKGRLAIVDGHCRVFAALEAGKKEMAVRLQRFSTLEERFDFLWRKNGSGPGAWGLFERALLARRFWKRGLPLGVLSSQLNLSLLECEDALDLGAFPPAFGRAINESNWPLSLSVLGLRRAFQWSLDGGERAALRRIKTLTSSQSMIPRTAQEARFYLEVAWSKSRPSILSVN